MIMERIIGNVIMNHLFTNQLCNYVPSKILIKINFANLVLESFGFLKINNYFNKNLKLIESLLTRNYLNFEDLILKGEILRID